MLDQGFLPTVAGSSVQTQAAVDYADRMHDGQERGDGTPFIRHPLEVASLLHEAGAPDHVITAGALHDLIEKTQVTSSDLIQRFGPRIARLVLAVTDDDRIGGYANRKAALRRQVAAAGEEALTLFAADKLSKLHELRREAAVDGELTNLPGARRESRGQRISQYRACLRLLERRLPDSPLVRELRDEFREQLRDRQMRDSLLAALG